MVEWSHAGPAVGAAFLASMVEVVEAFTIVLVAPPCAAGGRRVAGTAARSRCWARRSAVLGPLLDRVPLGALQLVIGVLLLLFGIGWLRKAALRAAGIIPLHDEAAIFARETAELGAAVARRQASQDWIAGIAAFKAVLLEGLEVIFIVIAVGAGRGLLWAAGLGALAACVLVLAVGAVAYRPLARVPENTLKFAVGVMLSAFGVFWTGEGLGVEWPGNDLALVRLCGALPRGGPDLGADGAAAGRGGDAVSLVRDVLSELVGMFLGDARMAAAILAVVAVAALAVRATGLPAIAGGAILLVGCVAVLVLGVRREARRRAS